MGARNTIADRDICNVPLPPDLHAIRARYTHIDILLHLLKHLAAASDQYPNEQTYQLKIKRVCLVNNRCVRTAFASSQQSTFQILSPLSCDYVGIANCLKVFFVDVLARWLFHIITLTAYLTFIYVEELWEAKFF